jgi:hypothetical protein
MHDSTAYLYELFGAYQAGVLEFTYLHKSGRVRTEWADLPLLFNDTSVAHLAKWNERGYNIYVGMTPRAAKKSHGRGAEKDALCVGHLWADVDCEQAGLSIADGVAKLIALELPPTMIVVSGGGVHGFWSFTEPLPVTPDSKVYIKRLLHGVANAIGEGADVKVRDLARIMRVPGFTNVKRGVGAYLYDVPIGARYYLMDLDVAFMPFAPKEHLLVRRHVPTFSDKHIPKSVQLYLDAGAAQGARNSTAFTAACRLFDAGFSQSEVEMMIGARALADGLGTHEVSALIASAARAQRSVVLPKHAKNLMIAEDNRQ